MVAKSSNAGRLPEEGRPSPHRESDTESHEETPTQAILKLEGSPHSTVLGSLMATNSEVRRALLALALDSGHQLGVLRAGLEFWPEDLPRGPLRASRRATS